MNTVEKIARAIDAWGWSGDSDEHHIRRAHSICDAQRAIAAMREPSEEMLKAGGVESAEYRCVDLAFCWRAMIDAALAEGGGE
jgi:hypothetical protein